MNEMTIKEYLAINKLDGFDLIEVLGNLDSWDQAYRSLRMIALGDGYILKGKIQDMIVFYDKTIRDFFEPEEYDCADSFMFAIEHFELLSKEWIFDHYEEEYQQAKIEIERPSDEELRYDHESQQYDVRNCK